MKRIVLFLLAAIILIVALIFILPSLNKVEKEVLKVNRIFDKAERVALKVNRFEKELFTINTKNIIEKSNKWDKEFGTFPEVFAVQILQISQKDKAQYYNELLAFTQNKDLREAYDSTAIRGFMNSSVTPLLYEFWILSCKFWDFSPFAFIIKS